MRIPADDPSTKLHALFPTLVYQANLTDHAAYKKILAGELAEFRFAAESGKRGKHNAGEYHGKILLHQQETLRPFFQILAEHIGKYLRVLGMRSDVFEMQCLKTWFVLCEPDHEADDAIVAHNHSCSDISWVYYVDVPADSAPIKFHAGRQLNTEPFGSAFHYDWHDDSRSAVSTSNWWNSATWSVHPTAGDLIMFPGHQLHSVDANASETTRVSIAGDIALVLREEFQNLEFGRTSSKHWLTLPLPE